MPGDPPHLYDAADSVVGLARTLRAAGVDAGPERVHAMVQALSHLDPARRDDVYWAGRLTLCAGSDDIDRYDRVFAAYFGDRPRTLVRRHAAPTAQLRLVQPADAIEGPGSGDEEADDSTSLASTASRTEVLRHRDIASLSATDRAAMQRLLAAFRLRGDMRRSRRTTAAHKGRVDPHRTLRRLMQAGGEPVRPAHRDRRERPRRVVLLVDVSGSMSSYADALLRFAHAAAHRDRGPATEVFTIGTRLTRVTREMAHRDPDMALKAIAASVPDWSGGTRLGVLIKEFLDQWGQRGMARGAIVVVLSDGWERGDVTLLGDQMARLHRLAHRVVWANPRAGRPGFAPLAAGMAAALPSVDDFVSGHSVTALEHLAELVAGVRTDQRAEVAHA
jgi:uncharacterized protein with von Willebrand factor type A (vWA) domain